MTMPHSQAAKNTSQFLNKMGIKKEKVMIWPAASPDLNPIENLLGLMKQMIYQDRSDMASSFHQRTTFGRQLLMLPKKINKETVQTLTNSVDESFIKDI